MQSCYSSNEQQVGDRLIQFVSHAVQISFDHHGHKFGKGDFWFPVKGLPGFGCISTERIYICRSEEGRINFNIVSQFRLT